MWKLGQQLIHDPEPISGIDEQVGGPGAAPQSAAVPGSLQGTHHGGPYRHHRAAVAPRLLHRQRGLLGDRVTLAVHHVVLDPRAANGREGGGSDVQRHAHHRDPALPELPQQCVGEVQSGGGCGRGAGVLGIYRLVAFGVRGVRRTVDVGRQRYRTVLLQVAGLERAIEGEHQRAAAVRRFAQRCGQAARERHRAPAADKLARATGKRQPAAAAIGRSQQQERHLPAPRQASGQACVQHPGVVQHHYAVRCQDRRQLGDPCMVQRSGRPLQHHEPCRAALRRRALCDQLGRQLKTEPAGPHRPPSAMERRRAGAPGAGMPAGSPPGRAPCAAGVPVESSMARIRPPGYPLPR